ncbi:MAG TPA: hypothetical protein PLA71_04115 [Saccharofermentans sp.]|nr:hypothetical protein [Saccharofermentans sp.]
MKKMIVFIISIMISLFILVSCKSTTVPDVEVVSQYTEEELQELASQINEESLIANWGEPQEVDNRRFWSVPLEGATEYLIAEVEDGNVISLTKSQYLYVTVVEDGYCLYGLNEYSTDSGNLAVMPSQDVFGNAIESEKGDMFVFQFYGVIMETYPAQLNLPYSATLMGQLSEEEIAAITEQITLP